MKPAPPLVSTPPDIVARTFGTYETELRDRAVALLWSLGIVRNTDQADDHAKDVLQNARLAALRHAQTFADLETSAERLAKAQTFVLNAVRDERDRVFKRRRRGLRVSDYREEDHEGLGHDELLDLVSAAPDQFPDEFTEVRQEVIDALPNALDRLTIALADEGYEGDDLVAEVAARSGRPCTYAAATSRLSRVRARLLRELRDRFRSHGQ